MVQVIDDPFSGNIFGRIGKGIGKGLSEQLPKEIERNRLASGLRQFEKQRKGLSPVEQFTRLASIPGITPEHLYTLSPLLKQEGARLEGEGFGKGAKPPQQTIPTPAIDQLSPKGTPEPYPTEQGIAEEAPGLKTLGSSRAQYTPIVRKSDPELMPRAAEIASGNPQMFPQGAIDALPLAREEENTRIANLEEQRNVGEAADTLETRLKTKLQDQWGKDATRLEGATDSNIPGSIQSNLERQLIKEFLDPKNKLTESQLITKYGEIGKNLAKAKTILDERSASSLLSGNYSPSKIETTINEARGAYEKANALEEFRDIITNKFNLSALGASAFAFPPANEKINAIFNTIEKPVQNEYGSYFPGRDPRTLGVKAADKISKFITDKDSLLTYTLEAKKKGLDENVFLKRLEQNRKDGLFKSNERQGREISIGTPFWTSLGDIWVGVRNLYKNLKVKNDSKSAPPARSSNSK